MMGREELLVELSKFKKLKAELKEMVECPVCVADSKLYLSMSLDSLLFADISCNSMSIGSPQVCLMTPREGPMACCPRGHLICPPCLRGIQVEERLAQN